MRIGGKALGRAAAVASIGIGIYDLVTDPNAKCGDCKNPIYKDFCKR